MSDKNSEEKDSSADWTLLTGEGDSEELGEAASPRVRLTEARLLDDRLQQGQGQAGEDVGPGMAEELGNLMVNDAFDMLIRKNDENNDDILRDMDSAITDLQKWREIRNRELALELDCMGPTGEGQWQAAPETDEGEGQAAAVPLGEGVDDSIGDSEGKTHYRHADDKAIESLEGILRSPRTHAVAKEDDVRNVLEKQDQKIKFSQIEQQVRETGRDDATLKLQQELMDMELADEAGMGALSTQLKGFESELDSFLERNK